MIGRRDRVVSAGCGLARRVSGRLRAHGYTYLVTEPAHPIVPVTIAEAWEYGVYSARYGDLPTPRHLLQLLQRVRGAFVPQERRWERAGRFIDPFRPRVQPGGYASAAEYEADGVRHREAVRRAFTELDVLVFTIGAAGAWASRADGAVYPVRPGAAGGAFDASRHRWLTFSAEEIAADMAAAIAIVRGGNPAARVILTVENGLSRTESADEARVVRRAVEALVALPSVFVYDAADAADEVAGLLDTRDAVGAGIGAPAAREHESFRESIDNAVRALCDEHTRGDTIKCLVWDLDETLWTGTVLEGDAVALRHGVEEVIEALDRRGIVQSIASRGDRDSALAALRQLRVAGWFLHPQIAWCSKAESIQRIADRLNLPLDAIAFIDDQPFERDEVAHRLPGVLCLDAADIGSLLADPRCSPAVVSRDGMRRRELYAAEIGREDARQAFAGSSEEFLAALGLIMTIRRATADDLDRAAELTQRTHRFNSSGRVYSRDELDALRSSPSHLLLLSDLTDRYGPYGTVGLCLVELGSHWTVRLLLMSCRVLSRGVSGVLLDHVSNLASAAGVRVVVPCVTTARNQALREVLAKMAALRASAADSDARYEMPPGPPRRFPPYVTVRLGAGSRPAVVDHDRRTQTAALNAPNVAL